jgi:hypothetical protein
MDRKMFCSETFFTMVDGDVDFLQWLMFGAAI